MTAEADYANSTVVAEWEDPDENNGEWPYPTRYVKRAISGQLADEIRARIGAARDAQVFITEAEMSGGWSEWTQETDYAMEIECGDFRKEFCSSWSENNLVALLRWLDQR